MARKIRSSEIETRTQRLQLDARRKPYFVRIGQGLSLGYRKPKAQVDGAWVLRVADGKQSNTHRAIGRADDYQDANNDTIFTYDQATARARKLASGDESGPSSGPPSGNLTTVKQSLEGYEADLRRAGKGTGEVVRIRKSMTAAFLATAIKLVKKTDWRKWRDEQSARGRYMKGKAEEIKGVEPLSPATINRLCATLKAALNRTADLSDDGLNRHQWEVGLGTIEDSNKARNVIIDDPNDVSAIVDCCYVEGNDIGLLAHVCAESGARPISQAANLLIANLQGGDNRPLLMMPVSRKGRGKKKVTHIATPISAKLYRALVTAAADRKPTERLLVKASGEPWGKSDHSRPFRRAVKAAGCAGRGITIYAFRHTSIVNRLLRSVPTRIVAASHDTSVAMIEKNYSVHITDHADDLLRNSLPDIAA
jgi:hypothetical protein